MISSTATVYKNEDKQSETVIKDSGSGGEDEEEGGLSKGAIIGISVGGGVILIVLVAIGIYCLISKKK